jgi:hypothetical protein
MVDSWVVKLGTSRRISRRLCGYLQHMEDMTVQGHLRSYRHSVAMEKAQACQASTKSRLCQGLLLSRSCSRSGFSNSLLMEVRALCRMTHTVCC